MNKTIILAILIPFIIWGCKKESTSAVLNVNVGSVSYTASGLTYTYYYSPSQLQTYKGDNLGKDRWSSHAIGDKVFVQYTLYGQIDSFAPNTFYFLNSRELADSVALLLPGGSKYGSALFTYDGDGHLLSEQWFNHSGTPAYSKQLSWSNSNLTSMTVAVTDTTFAHEPAGQYTFDYYTDKTNTTGNKNIGVPYLGLSSKNTVKTLTYNDGANTTVTHYNYYYDTQGYVLSQLSYQDSSGTNGALMDSVVYSYYF